MNRGNIEQAGTPLEIYRQPQTPFVAEFIGTTNFLKGQVAEVGEHRLKVRVHDTIISLPLTGEHKPGEEVRMVLRPEMIRFAETKGEGKLTGIEKVSISFCFQKFLRSADKGKILAVLDGHYLR
jgi:iron(III) transport system ATP-binding protein